MDLESFSLQTTKLVYSIDSILYTENSPYYTLSHKLTHNPNHRYVTCRFADFAMQKLPMLQGVQCITTIIMITNKY